jgi:valyl-tRNA synthetase
MKLPKVYNPKGTEDKIYKLWEKSGFFNPDKLPGKREKTYTIVIPPPNITGELHMGHALNTVVQDILIRWKRLQGFKTLWLPGTDHAGIAAQNVVEKELKKEGKTRFDLGREKFVKRVWQWVDKYGNIILEQLKKMGASCDWSRTRFTLDKDYVKAVETAFLHYYKKSWIYQGKRVINWCPRCQTSLSDLELEYKERKGKLWHINYPLLNSEQGTMNYEKSKGESLSAFSVQRSDFIAVATTRPETMLGDAAVAVNPKDKRYKNLVGKKAILPLVNRKIPIIADSLVDPKFGTGAVKITPAHDLKDYEISLRHKLSLFQVINENGKITKEAPFAYQGLSVLEARQKVVEDLKKANLLGKTEDYSHQIPVCYRCDTVVELLPSEQWFLKMKELAKMAEKPVKKGKVKFHPKNFEKGYFDWLKNIRDWCISRQLWWGHQLPAWQCQTGKISNFKFRISKPNKYFTSPEKPKNCLLCKKCRPKRIVDVLDTWFSSALWPFATLGWPPIKNLVGGKSTSKTDLNRFYPADVLSTDRGIINLWVARMIFSGLEFMKEIPFRDVYIHATVLTQEGKRMSKSLGTGIDPLNLIEKYGADATRFGISFQVMGGQDIRFVEDNIVMGRKFCNKIWNAARFVLLQIGKSEIRDSKFGTNLKSEVLNSKNLTNADKKILSQLRKVIKSVNNDLENFRFGQAAHKLYDFFWHDFCDKYIEQSKKQCQDTNYKLQTTKTLLYILLTSLKLLHPFIPFITEEIYQKLPLKNKKKFLMIENWPQHHINI